MLDHETHQAQAPRKDPAAGHGMLVVGVRTVFLSHLPMFMNPHDWQVILEATFTKQGSDPARAYTDDRAKHRKEKVYTLEPKPFVLPDLFPADASHPPRVKVFQGSVFRGHFERTDPKVPVATDVVVTVTNVVLARKFDPAAGPLSELACVLYGKGQKGFVTLTRARPGSGAPWVLRAELKADRREERLAGRRGRHRNDAPDR